MLSLVLELFLQSKNRQSNTKYLITLFDLTTNFGEKG